MTKNWIALGICLALSVIIAQPSSGQRLLKNIQKRAEQSMERKVEQRANEKIDEKIDESLDKVEESLEKDPKDAPSGSDSGASAKDNSSRGLRLLKGMGISGEPVPVADSYNFNQLIQMRIETYKKSGKLDSEGEFITYLNPNTKSMAYQFVSGNMAQDGQGMFIIDAENGATIILSDEKGQKTGVVYGMGSFMESLGKTYEEELTDIPQSPEAYLTNPNVKKTGQTKNVAGYSCEEYIYSDEDTESEIWITKDLKMNTQDFFGALFKVSMASNGMGWGYMMESTSKNKKNGEKSIMKVTKVDKNSNIKFNMGDYQITNIGSITMPK